MKLRLLALYCALIFLTSCLQERQIAPVASTQSWFEGVRSAKNKGGSPPSILIEWNSSSLAVSAYRVYSVIYNKETKKNELSLLKEVASDVKSYLYSNELIPGTIYSFIVRAVDAEGKEDNNMTQASTVAFNGISNVKINGPTTATVYLDTSLGSFDEVRVYAQPEGEGNAKVKVASAIGDVAAIDISGLRSGTKYKFFVSAYMSYLNAEDGNELFFTGQTHSTSFGSGAATEDISKYQYRGMLSVQAFGNAPNAPVAPTSKLVRLTWLPFGNASSSTKYKVVRAESSQAVVTTTNTPCSATTNSSCVVTACNNQGTGVQTCEDTTVADAPKTYHYVVTLVKKDLATSETWAEELPQTNASDFYTKVAIPPSYMVLVQRDAANYEMCKMIGKASDPRRHQRCVYTGIGAVPFNKGPNKPPLGMTPSHYDFGYNLFVDRYRTGCQWTRNSSSCGPDGCIGIGSNSSNVAPNNALGQPGDVYFNLTGGYGANCYYKRGTTWLQASNPNNALTAAELAVAYGPDPGTDKKTPQANGFNMQSAFLTCNAQGTEYGTKRLMRRREYVQAAAFPTMEGEANAIVDRVESSFLRIGRFDTGTGLGGQNVGFRRCANSNGTSTSLLTLPTTLAELMAPTNYRSQINQGNNPIMNYMTRPYFIGTPATSNCISRWGSQDPIASATTDGGNGVLADTFIRTNLATDPTPNYSPVDSDFDSGVVKDWSNSVMTYHFNGVVGPAFGGPSDQYANREMSTANAMNWQSYILPLGVALVPPTTASAIYSTYNSSLTLVYNGTLGAAAFSGGSNAFMSVIHNTNVRYTLIENAYNRFSYTLHADEISTRFGVWCALEAE